MTHYQLKPRVLDLFSGVGGFSLGLGWAGLETVAFCEIDDKCRLVLAKHWPSVPQYTDVKTLTGEQLEKDGVGDIGLICGGYPCQPFSVAGKREGADDDRHLWPEFRRLVAEIRPAWVIAENVAGHITMGLDSVLADLDALGYASQTYVIPACAVGAPHRRDRVWIVANGASVVSERGRLPGFSPSPRKPWSGLADGGHVADASSQRLEKRIVPAEPDELGFCSGSDNEGGKGSGPTGGDDGVLLADEEGPGGSTPFAEPRLGRAADGISRWLDGSWDTIPRTVTGRNPGRVDRIKQLGNSVVPQIPYMIGKAILEAESAIMGYHR
jgi:DNA (cytosine-5)-methyltransferase 1